MPYQLIPVQQSVKWNTVKPGSEVKFFIMLNSAENEISNAQRLKISKKVSFFSGSDKPRMLFFMLISIKMPTIVGILILMSRTNFMLSCACNFYNLGTWFKRLLLLSRNLPQEVKFHFKQTCIKEAPVLNFLPFIWFLLRQVRR